MALSMITYESPKVANFSNTSAGWYSVACGDWLWQFYILFRAIARKRVRGRVWVLVLLLGSRLG